MIGYQWYIFLLPQRKIRFANTMNYGGYIKTPWAGPNFPDTILFSHFGLCPNSSSTVHRPTGNMYFSFQRMLPMTWSLWHWRCCDGGWWLIGLVSGKFALDLPENLSRDPYSRPYSPIWSQKRRYSSLDMFGWYILNITRFLWLNPNHCWLVVCTMNLIFPLILGMSSS